MVLVVPDFIIQMTFTCQKLYTVIYISMWMSNSETY